LDIHDRDYRRLPYNPAMHALPASLLAQALNGLLARQPMARARLRRHAGKHLVLALPPVSLELAVAEDGSFRMPAAGAPADDPASLTLIPQPAALPAWISGGGMRELFRAEGDGVFAADIAHAVADFDWVLALRPYLGDMVASRVERFLQGLGPWRAGVVDAAGRNLAEYAVHEAGMLAEPHATREFIAGVDHLREDTDRLEARLLLLEAQRTPG